LQLAHYTGQKIAFFCLPEAFCDPKIGQTMRFRPTPLGELKLTKLSQTNLSDPPHSAPLELATCAPAQTWCPSAALGLAILACPMMKPTG